jgi:hypothetical protein
MALQKKQAKKCQILQKKRGQNERRRAMDKDTALNFALEALQFGLHVGFDESSESQIKKCGKAFDQHNKAITAIKQALAAPVQSAERGEPVWCGHCNGSGRMVRDPDIGTDQECFVCDGAGVPAAPVQEDWGPGPHECHSLTAAPVQEPVAWRYRGILHDFDPSDWAEGPVTPLYTTPLAAPVPERNFCERCGKRLGDYIHTCTPPATKGKNT